MSTIEELIGEMEDDESSIRELQEIVYLCESKIPYILQEMKHEER